MRHVVVVEHVAPLGLVYLQAGQHLVDVKNEIASEILSARQRGSARWPVLLLVLALISQVAIKTRNQKQIVDRSYGSNPIPNAGKRSGDSKCVVPSSLMMCLLKNKSIIDTADEQSGNPVVLCQTIADRRSDLPVG
jgi:hypothetical protein